MKVLVTGISGILGSALAEIDRNIIGTYNKNKPNIENKSIFLDITDIDKVLMELIKEKPDIVIHTAALTDVDYCEDHKEEAFSTNVIGTKNILEACKKIDAKIVFMSTDFVFDGLKGLYKETDLVNPISYYSKTKVECENIVRAYKNHIIVRTGVIYGKGTKKFVNFVIDSLKNKQKIKVVLDHFNSPTLNFDLAKAILKLLNKNFIGTIHLAGSERISRYDFALNIAYVFGLDNNLIVPIKSSDFDQKARRPKDSSLNVEKAKNLGICLSSTIDGLKKMKGLL